MRGVKNVGKCWGRGKKWIEGCGCGGECGGEVGREGVGEGVGRG